MHSIDADPAVGYQVDSAQFRRRAPRIQLSDDPDTATAQTVQEMCWQIHEAAVDPLVQRCAQNAVASFRSWAHLTNQFDPAGIQAEACWWWCKHYLRFRHHGSMFEAWSADLGDPSTKLQLLIAPDVLVRMKRMEGDCAIYTMMLCALLESLSVDWEICTGAVDEQQPEIFSHVWARAVLGGDMREALDASHGTAPGWQVPDYDLHRAWIFDSHGRRIYAGSQTPQRFNGLHAYRRRGMGASGIDPETGEVWGTDTSVSNPYLQSGVTETDLVSGYFGNSGTATAPAQNSSQWASFATSLLKSGLTLAEINSIQPGTVVNKDGSILRQTTGYAVPVGSSVSTLASSLSGNTVIYLGVGLVALLVVGSFLKK